MGEKPLQIALSEIAFNKARAGTLMGRVQLAETELQRLAFQTVINTHECPVLHLTTPEECNGIGAPTDICWDDDYGMTRVWAEWIRKQLPDIHGIRYYSRRAMANANVVTFGDRCRPSQSFDGGGSEYRFVDTEGEDIIRRAAFKASIDIVR